jgi:hypothetical protein
MLFTSGEQQFLQSEVGGGGGEPSASWHPLWWPPTKIAGRYLAPYLFERDKAEAMALPPEGLTEVEIPLTGLAPAAEPAAPTAETPSGAREPGD